MKQTLAFLLKFAVTLGIFVAIFLEFGGGYAPVRTAELTAPGTFEAANPDYPGLVGRLRARVRGTPLPSPRVPLSLHDRACALGLGFLARSSCGALSCGIVTPRPLGLDAGRLYDPIRLPRRPVECTTVLAVERVIGMVGLFAVILLFMPFAGRITHGQSIGELVAAMKMPLAATAVFGVLILLQPGWFRGWLRLLPGERARRFAASAIDAASAYRERRGYLVLALALAVIGQLTTTLMYFANAMSLATQNVRASEVLFASAVMTGATFIAPSASGEGVRELAFVWLLGSRAGAAKAFLIGNLGFWIEKIPLSVPGGIMLLLRRDPALQGVGRDELLRVRREVEAELPVRPRAAG